MMILTMPVEGIEFENEIREFLSSIGFADVPGWGASRERFHLGPQEIDAFGRLGALYVVMDVKTSSSPSGEGVQTLLQKINGYKDQVVQGIKERYSSYGYRKCLFVFWTKNIKLKESHKQMAKGFGIALRDDFDLKYYSDAARLLDNPEITRNSFLKDISLQLETDVFETNPTHRITAIRTKVGDKRFYTFVIPVRDMLRLAYVFRAETNNILESYQRLLKGTKIRKIRRYLRAGGFFANNVLVATDEDLRLEEEGDDDDETLAILPGNLDLPDKPCYLEIIDGQHRLLAYSSLHDLMDQKLVVTAVTELDKVERAKLFVVVNKEQTRVPADLLWDLYTMIEPDSIRGKISKFVQEKLNEDGPLKGLITLPRVRSHEAYLRFTNLCSALFNYRTKLYRDYGARDSFFNVLKAYFEVLTNGEGLTEDWERSKVHHGRKGFVCTNNAISIELYLLAKLLKRREDNGQGFPTSEEIKEWKQETEDQVVEPFQRYLEANGDGADREDPYGILRRETTSEGARRKAAEEIYDSIQF